jgi:hypothetical protein
MIIAGSSQMVAGDGIDHRTCEKSETDGKEKNIEHGSLNRAATIPSVGLRA